MPLFYKYEISASTKLGIWKIDEQEDFFLAQVPLQQDIRHPHKRLQHLAGRYLLKYFFPDFPYEEILIADTRKPYLPYEQYHFSISHCGAYAAAIVSSTQRVGVDIEIPGEKIEKIKMKFLNANELKFLASSPVQQTENYKMQTVLWASKETVFKWWGWGNIDFSDHILLQPFEMNDAGDMNAALLREKEILALPLRYKVFEELCLVWTATDL